MPDGERVCVLGAGAWGTALAIQAARAGGAAARVSLWARDPVRAATMRAKVGVISGLSATSRPPLSVNA